MNRAICLLSLFSLCGIAAAQTAALSGKPFFDLPLFLPSAAVSDQSQTDGASTPAETTAPAPTQAATEKIDKHAFGVLPNYRTANGLAPFQPVTTKQKFIIATKDSFDWPVYLNTAFFAGLSQLQGSDNDVYGQGVKGFAHRFGISYADQVIGNYFPEAIVPTLLHMDPRYYRKGEGSVPGRLWYAVSHIFVSKNDKGNAAFNSPEILGNAMASAIGLSYHTHERTFGDFAYQWGFTYVTADAVGQVLKEFWPDIKHKFRKHETATP
jgi:hypothetical protein